MDSLHKVVDPESYSCKLCDLTFGTIGERKAWKEFREDLEVETDFLHRDEFRKAYASKFGHKFEFPIILAQTANGLEVFLSKHELAELDTTEALIEKIRERIELY